MLLENMKKFQETSMNKSDEPELEESSWTFYFEEFLRQNDKEMMMSCDDEGKKVRLKKRKTKRVMIDDSLEDTATSPASTPKVAYFDQVKIKNKNKNKDISHEDKAAGTCEEGNKRMVNPNMELKKRGLCLVPLSSLPNYLS